MPMTAGRQEPGDRQKFVSIQGEDMMLNKSAALVAWLSVVAGLAIAAPASAQDRTVKITGFGPKSGVVRVFGVNSEAAFKAAAEDIHKAAPVTTHASPNTHT